MKSCECVADVLSKLRNDDRNLGSQDVNNFAQVMQRFSSVALGCLRSFVLRTHHTPPCQPAFPDRSRGCLTTTWSLWFAYASKSQGLYNNGWSGGTISTARILRVFWRISIDTLVCTYSMLSLIAGRSTRWSPSGRRSPFRKNVSLVSTRGPSDAVQLVSRPYYCMQGTYSRSTATLPGSTPLTRRMPQLRICRRTL